MRKINKIKYNPLKGESLSSKKINKKIKIYRIIIKINNNNQYSYNNNNNNFLRIKTNCKKN